MSNMIELAPDDRGLTPVGRETIQDRVYGQLRRALIDGLFAAGEVLRIVELAETLKTSTMPVREALARLVSEQALEALPNRSVRVPLITGARLDDIASARVLIECRLMAMAMPRLGPEDLDVLRQINGDCDAAFTAHNTDIGPRTSALNQRFHFHIYRAAGSQVLLPVVESLWLQSGVVVRAAAQIHSAESGLSATHHHSAMIDALQSGDEAAAATSLTRDIRRSFDLVRSQLAGQAEAA